MKIKNIEIQNFRCIEKCHLNFNENINIILGDNAQGKSSLVEAIFMLALSKSYRTNNEKEMIKYDRDFLTVKAKISKNDYFDYFEIIITNKDKKLKINYDEYKKVSAYIGNIMVVMFSPDDLNIITGDPAVKRKFLDMDLGHMDREYLIDLIYYKNVLKQRNELLKKYQTEKKDFNFLNILTEQLCIYGEKIINFRKIKINKLSQIASKVYFEIVDSKGTFEIKYITKSKGPLFTELKSSYERDIILGTTSIGPHRDFFKVFVNGKDVSVYGSQGEQRTTILSIKLALVDCIKEIKNEIPILILDDVFSELDKKRIACLTKKIDGLTQTFITTTDLSIDQKLLNKAKIFIVEEGNFKEREMLENE